LYVLPGKAAELFFKGHTRSIHIISAAGAALAKQELDCPQHAALSVIIAVDPCFLGFLGNDSQHLPSSLW
jgi:hypothetical protein